MEFDPVLEKKLERMALLGQLEKMTQVMAETGMERQYYKSKYAVKRFKEVMFDDDDEPLRILVEWKNYPARYQMTWENPLTLRQDLGFEDYYDLLWPHKAVTWQSQRQLALSPPRIKRQLECPPAPRKKRLTSCRCGHHPSAEDSDNDDNMPPR